MRERTDTSENKDTNSELVEEGNNKSLKICMSTETKNEFMILQMRKLHINSVATNE